MPLFKRISRLYIGTIGGTGSLLIDGLRVTFDLKKLMTPMPNAAKIEVYNLSDKTRNNIKDSNIFVLLQAGYEDDKGLMDIYKGVIYRVSHRRQPPDVITTIEALDRIAGMGTAKVSLGYPANTSAIRILNDLVKKLGLSKKSSSVYTKDRLYTNGFSTVGSAIDSLDRVTKYLGLVWSIQDQEIKFIPADGSDLSSPTLISATTGMIEAPVYVSNIAPPIDLYAVGNTKLQEGKTGLMQVMKPGWKVKSLLLPQIEPKNKVVIESIDMPKGKVYTVESVQHNGDTIGAGPWETTLEVYE